MSLKIIPSSTWLFMWSHIIAYLKYDPLILACINFVRISYNHNTGIVSSTDYVRFNIHFIHSSISNRSCACLRLISWRISQISAMTYRILSDGIMWLKTHSRSGNDSMNLWICPPLFDHLASINGRNSIFLCGSEWEMIFAADTSK